MMVSCKPLGSRPKNNSNLCKFRAVPATIHMTHNRYVDGPRNQGTNIAHEP